MTQNISSKISVILIVRDGADFIAAALGSVVAGMQQPSEILIVDGGSKDETRTIAEGFDLVRVIIQQSKGIANAYNEGIEAAQNDLVAFISHDDLWEPNKLKLQAAYMQDHTEAEFCVTMVQHFLHPGSQIPEGFRPELLDEPRTGMMMEALMARKSVFQTVGYFDAKFAVAEDTDWFARVKDAGVPYGILPDVLVRKRVHDKNSSIHHQNINKLLLRAMRSSIERKKYQTTKDR